MKPTVSVIMSTYNGERYIQQQLESIWAQRDVNVRLLVRDDGSSDKTPSLLDDYQKQGRLNWYTGLNLKPAGSFMQLLTDAPESEYYAFADQDDYWQEDKLSTATTMLDSYKDTPALYFCQTQMTDAQLNPIATPQLSPLLTFGESLVYAFATGCTIVMNAVLRRILIAHAWPKDILHDQWSYMVTLALGGKVIFDPTPHLLYRQHGDNVVGLNKSTLQLWKERFQRVFIDKAHIRSAVATQLLEVYGSMMDDEHRTLLLRFLECSGSLSSRLKLMKDSNYHCGNRKTERLFKLGVLMKSI